MTSPLQQKWIEIANTLTADPDAALRCPVCEKANLEVLDTLMPNGTAVYERHVWCAACGARTAIFRPQGRPRTVRHIKVMADYHASPLWLQNAGMKSGMITVADVGVSEPLASELTAWAAEYTATLDMDDPPGSGFHDIEKELAFVARGRELTEKLAKELGSGTTVTFFHIGEAGQFDRNGVMPAAGRTTSSVKPPSALSVVPWLVGMASPTFVSAFLLLRWRIELTLVLILFIALCVLWAYFVVHHRGDAARWGSLPSRSRVGSVVLWTGIAVTINFFPMLPVMRKWLEPCDNIIQHEVRLDDAKRAVVFHRECGATTGFSTQVSVLVHNEPLPRSPGNALALGGKHMIDDIRWETPTKLSIKMKPGAKVFSKTTRVDDIEIDYMPGASAEARVAALSSECGKENAAACLDLAALFEPGNTFGIPPDPEKAHSVRRVGEQLLDRQCDAGTKGACDRLWTLRTSSAVSPSH
jgi:hypothetical protein